VHTCFVYCFNSVTCACSSIEVFRGHRGVRGGGGARAEWITVARRNGECRVGAAYFQSSSPALSYTASTSSEDLICVVSVWEEKTRAARGNDDCLLARSGPCAKVQSFRGAMQMHPTPDRGPDLVVWPCCIFSRIFLPLYHTACFRGPSPTVACCLAAALFQASRQISLCASAAPDVTSQPSSPRYDTIAAAVLGHVRDLVPACAT
jgi:hypothetical protein